MAKKVSPKKAVNTAKKAVLTKNTPAVVKAPEAKKPAVKKAAEAGQNSYDEITEELQEQRNAIARSYANTDERNNALRKFDHENNLEFKGHY